MASGAGANPGRRARRDAGLLLAASWRSARPICRCSTRTSRSRRSRRRAREERRHLLARHRHAGRDMLSRTDLGLPARARLGHHRDARRLCRRHDVRAGRRLSRRLVGPGHLVRRQRAAVVPGDGALHPDPELSRAERLQHRHRRHLRLRAGDHAHRARPRARHQDRATTSSRPRRAASIRSAS